MIVVTLVTLIMRRGDLMTTSGRRAATRASRVASHVAGVHNTWMYTRVVHSGAK